MLRCGHPVRRHPRQFSLCEAAPVGRAAQTGLPLLAADGFTGETARRAVGVLPGLHFVEGMDEDRIIGKLGTVHP